MVSALHRLWLARTKQTNCKSMFFAARAPLSQKRAGARQEAVAASCGPPSWAQCLRCGYASLADSLFSVFFLLQGRDGRASVAARERRSCEERKGWRARCGRPRRKLPPPFIVVSPDASDVFFCSVVQVAAARFPDSEKMQERAMSGCCR